MTEPCTALAPGRRSLVRGPPGLARLVLGTFPRGKPATEPYVSRDGANGSVERVPGTLPSEGTFTLAVELATRLRMLATPLLYVHSCEEHQRGVQSSLSRVPVAIGDDGYRKRIWLYAALALGRRFSRARDTRSRSRACGWFRTSAMTAQTARLREYPERHRARSPSRSPPSRHRTSTRRTAISCSGRPLSPGSHAVDIAI
jgi:hypothetical protein